MPQRYFGTLQLLRRKPKLIGYPEPRRSPLAGVLTSFVLGVCVGVAVAPPARAAKADVDRRAEVVALIGDAARDYGVDEGLMLRIAWCESRFNPDAFNRASNAIGVFQWLPSSWADAEHQAAQEAGPEYERIGWSPFDAWQNIQLTAWAIHHGQVWRWRACL